MHTENSRSYGPIRKGPDDISTHLLQALTTVKWSVPVEKGTLAAHSVACCQDANMKVRAFLPVPVDLELPDTEDNVAGEAGRVAGGQ